MTWPAGPMRAVRLAVTAGLVLGVALATPGTARAARVPPLAAESRSACSQGAAHAFPPARLSIPGATGPTRVLARGRDRLGVPIPPPLTDRGKWQLAWDRGVRPGARHGVVRLTAHTYPRSGAYGSALGNRLLTRLHTGERMVMSGADGQRLCYRVIRRVRVRARQSVPAYYTSAGPPRLAILVCSGRRLGPGNWSHRTIWYAAPRN